MLTCFWFYLVRIRAKDKLKAGFLKRVNGSTQGELNFCEGEPVGYKGVNQKNRNG